MRESKTFYCSNEIENLENLQHLAEKKRAAKSFRTDKIRNGSILSHHAPFHGNRMTSMVMSWI